MARYAVARAIPEYPRSWKPPRRQFAREAGRLVAHERLVECDDEAAASTRVAESLVEGPRPLREGEKLLARRPPRPTTIAYLSIIRMMLVRPGDRELPACRGAAAGAPSARGR